MKKMMLLALCVVFFAGMSLALTQTTTAGTGAGSGTAAPTIDVLGAHNNYGRGCAGCHAPHSGWRGAGGNAITNQTVDTEAGNNALFAQDMGPLFGQTFGFGDNGSYIFTAPTQTTAYTTGLEDARGILMCLACHDGAIAKGAMMKNASYEQAIGVLPSTYGNVTIPTLLGADGTTAANAYGNDHPVGENATLSAAMHGAFSTTTPPANGVYYPVVNGALDTANIAVSGEYADFVADYGWPAIAPGKWSAPTPINSAGQPYLLCTTCHNQHSMNIYTSTTASQIENDGGGKHYTTYFFINAPYDPGNSTGVNAGGPSEVAQFCRQCHFGESNEANGSGSGGIFLTNLD